MGRQRKKMEEDRKEKGEAEMRERRERGEREKRNRKMCNN
jgi:hypothetical protein